MTAEYPNPAGREKRIENAKMILDAVVKHVSSDVEPPATGRESLSSENKVLWDYELKLYGLDAAVNLIPERIAAYRIFSILFRNHIHTKQDLASTELSTLFRGDVGKSRIILSAMKDLAIAEVEVN